MLKIKNKKIRMRLRKLKAKQIAMLIGGVLLLIAAFFVLKPFLLPTSYDLSRAGFLLPSTSQSLTDKIKYDAAKKTYTLDNGQAAASNETRNNGTQNVRVTAHQNASQGVTVSDPTNSVDFTIKPKFNLLEGRQNGGHVVYPLRFHDGLLVYTMQGAGVKENILLNHSPGDSLNLDYTLELGANLEARLERDGSIGVYGNTLLSGDISTGSEADAALLKKARENADKNTLLFRIPKPYVLGPDHKPSEVQSAYKLDKNKLTLAVSGLSKASYPLAIDPSIYVASAEQFMAGNNETNINFNVANSLIEKGRTTGARFDSWTATTTLPQATWGAASVAAGGFVYTVGGTTFEKQLYTAQGASTFVVPAGVTSITTKAWGGGGGGGAGGSAAAGGTGGGAGYVTATYTVTPGETLNVYVGGGGAAGTRNTAGGGGGGGGYSSLYRSTTPLAIAAGGAGGGGGRNSAGHTGGAGGAGGGTSGIAGSASGIALGGGLGSPSTFGLGGTGGNNPGSNGAALVGGLGGDGRTSAGADGSGAIGGLATGGDGGSVQNTARSGGGGGSAGWYGGGGGSGSTSGTGGGGGGGGSSMTDAGATGVTNSAGSGISPGNSGDSERGTAGNGGGAGASGGVGTAGANGLVIISYGSGGTKVSSTVNWAQFNTSTGTIDSANPGNGACSSWCTDSAYNLPAARTNLSLVAYSGFLYAFGGVDGTGTRQNSVYIAKLGANGEPQKWHPTDTNKNNWVYWYQDTNLSSIRSDASAVAYNNRMYLIGGRSTGGPVSTVEIANINPTGTLGTWTSSTALSSNLYGHSAQVYNDHLYVVGGAITVGGAPQTTVRYTNVNSDGTLNSWNTTTPLTTGRMSAGGNFTAVWGAYLYVSGGCSAVNGSGYCSTIRSDSEVASINTDGTLDVWNTVGGVSSTRTSASVITWRDKIYAIGGCSTQNISTGDCNGTGAMLSSIVYGSINRDGDASTVGATVDTSTAPCSTLSTDCNLPGTTYIGNMLTSSVVTNGYLYVIGGCTNNTCSTTTGNVAYTAISSTGHMTAPTCNAPNNLRGNTWCVDTTNTISGGLAAASPVVFGGRLYLVGGLNGTSNTGTILRTTLNTNGSIGAWTSQTMSGLSVNSVSYLYSFARANPSDVANNPGNLYIFGGCSTSSAAGCTAYSQNVYKCNIVQTTGAIASCSTGSQLQIGNIPGDASTGLGIMSGTVYANYVYLIGGVSPNLVDLKTVRYAKIDNSNNIVTAGASGWTESPKQMEVGRRRAAAFGYNGYIYAVGGYEASTGVLADIEFIKVNVSDGSLGSATEGFTVSAVSINQRWGLTVPVSNSFAYVIGGCTDGASPSGCNTRTDTIQTFQIYNNDSGAPAGFSTSTNTYSSSPNRIGASATVLGGRIYVAGGCTSATDCTAATSNISYATIDISGNLSTSWSSTTSSLPEGRAWGQLETVGGYLYYIGGQVGGGGRRSTIYYANPDSGTGDIAASPGWLTTSGGIGDTPTGDPVVRSKFSATVWNGRIYVIGGESAASNNLTTIYKTPYMPSGGDIAVDSWAYQNNTLPVGRSGATAVAYANNLYVLGGFNGTNYFNDVMYAQIDNSGTIGSWNYTTSLPNAVAYADGFAANGYIYLVGGRTAATVCDPSMLVAPISANTTIASGNNPTGVGEWYMTNQRYTGARYGAAAVYYDGKAYVLGGGCGSTLTYASPVTQQTTLLSQPQVAKYSIRIDTDSDVFPNQWLLNGVDNSIGANWQLKYRSMPNTTTSCVSPAMTTWGRETNFGDVTLGLPGVYTPKDASGATTNCARFYYFNVTVDSSQAFGYPDDVSRGPTITDLTLQFTADPSKRLMHGRTFTGGVQQPDDTPYYAQ